jgi:hypothetical protein
MSEKRKHTVDEVLKSLSRKRDIKINNLEIQILVGDFAHNDLGNKSWGKIDFLVNHNNYRRFNVTKFI